MSVLEFEGNVKKASSNSSDDTDAQNIKIETSLTSLANIKVETNLTKKMINNIIFIYQKS